MDYTKVLFWLFIFYVLLLFILMVNSSEIITDSWNPNVDGELTEKSYCAKLERNGYRCLVKRFKAGNKFPDHTHDTDRMIGPLTCTLKFIMYGEEVIMKDGDTVFVPKDVLHSVEILPSDRLCISMNGYKPDEL